MSCELCLGPSTADPVLVRAARGLPMVPPPPDVAGYLGSRPLGHPATMPPPRSSSDISGVDSVMMGKYKLLRRIGTGGMAEIFLARQQGPEGFQKTIALKRILPHLCQDESFIQMFLQEARVAARVSHPNVVQILDLGQIDGRYFIAMEYVKGSDLRTILRVSRALGAHIPIPIVCRIGSDVCAGLSAAHGHRDDSNTPAPIVHRDISPHNILVAESGVCKITDFGIAKAADSVSDTVSGVLKGKLTYLAPERLLNVCDPLDVRPDLFSIGVVLYECITGVHPFRRENEGATVHAILNEEPEPLSSYVAEVPDGLERIIRRALSKIPDERYFEAQLFRRELEEFLVRTESPATSFHVATWMSQLMKDAAASAILEATHTSIVVDVSEFTPSSHSGKR
jgi:eukaryotic-like serine/threonine-protein kinase